MARESSLSGDRLALLLLIAFVLGRCSTELDRPRQSSTPVALTSDQSDIDAAEAVAGAEAAADAAMNAADAAAAATDAAESSPQPLRFVAPVEPSPAPATFERVEDQVDGSDYVYYPNCSTARAAGAAPIHYGEPGYAPKLDRDRDGVACE